MPSDCMLLPWSSAQQFDAYQLKTESFRPNLYIYDYNSSSSATTPSSEEPDSESTSAESPTCSRLNNSFEDAKLQYVDERRYTESPGFKLKASEQSHHSKWREHLHHRADFRKRRKLDQPKLVEPKSGRIHKILSQDTLDQLERRRKVKSSKRDENSNIVQLKDRLDPSSPIGRICLLDEEDERFVFEIMEHEVLWDKETVKGIFAPDLRPVDESDECVLEIFDDTIEEELLDECF
ncbi:unnamed protein product [Bursaphelenchus xylophilus]|uniref:(pine wood nematode) hypothetical protein n=1 Tax=Bursaphelenchus xylophilus TaxID=6326 RepID=A0A1I7SE41_BURXY|nr:unnamed protein product [Bursaphelenchus xylophilus]CAG9104219.1 unnamed protein product [Bursaphelenchus xylophilus]